MGGGNWERESFKRYSKSAGRTVRADGALDSSLTDGQLYTQRHLHKELDPKNVMRECCDSEEHPATVARTKISASIKDSNCFFFILFTSRFLGNDSRYLSLSYHHSRNQSTFFSLSSHICVIK